MDTTSIRIWDLPIRYLSLDISCQYWFRLVYSRNGGNWMEWHERTGIFILSLVIWRIIWGFVGSDTACFTQFS